MAPSPSMYACSRRVPTGRLCLALAAIPLAAAPAAATSLFLTVGGQFQATAEIPGLNSTNAFLPLTLPGPGSNQAMLNMFVISDVSYLFTETPGHSQLDVSFAHNASFPNNNSRDFTYSNGTFTGAAGTAYTISGQFSMPPGTHVADLYLDVSLIAAPGGTIFRHNTVRSLTGGSAIVVGVPIAGDTLTGSPTGVLAAGVTYTLAFNISTRNMNFGAGGVTSSGTISVALAAPCYANCDGSTTPPVLNVIDFACFLNRFASGDSRANCDGSTTAPVLNVQDFACFLNLFAGGCP